MGVWKSGGGYKLLSLDLLAQRIGFPHSVLSDRKSRFMLTDISIRKS